jgi:hypothetical protein
MEGLRLAVLFLVGLDDVSEGSRHLSLAFQSSLLGQQWPLTALWSVDALAHVGLEAFLLTEAVRGSGIGMWLIVGLGLEYVFRRDAVLVEGLSVPPVGDDGGHAIKQLVGFRL